MLNTNNKLITDIHLAATLLNNGELVAFPTETVYGLGADARNPQAINKVFQAKGRPADHPLIVHLADAAQLTDWAQDIPATAWLLAAHFWPGPLTIILMKQPTVSGLITGGQVTIGLRVPNHPVTLELLKQFGSGLVGPSANIYGHVSPTTAQHVAADLGANPLLAAILDGGPCNVGIESTIIYLAEGKPVIMRQGVITAAEISAVLGVEVDIAENINNQVRTSGSHASHYAPRTPVYLVPAKNLINIVNDYTEKQQLCSVISFQLKPADLAADLHWQQMSSDPHVYAQDLYATLRLHDQLNTTAILIEQPPTNTVWAAINDRLSRASFKR